MANYSIFVLDESQISISGGKQLDGVTQGDGSHLTGETITLNSNAWNEIQISDDDDDTDFEDNDDDQELDETQTVDGTSYAEGVKVEAEYGLTLTDGVDTWEVVGFNVNNSTPAYGTVEGLAFIGGPGGFPPTGVPLTVVSAREGPDYPVDDYATPICYDRGTLISTDRGLRPIESLRIGDRVVTQDNGAQPIQWIGNRHAIGGGRCAPVEIAAGVLGAFAPLRVSQQHRILLRGPNAELLFGDAEVFAPAAHLINGTSIRLTQVARVQYFHLLLERHEIIFANGVASDSLHIHAGAATGDSGEALFFPELADRADLAGAETPLARRSLRRYETALLLARGHVIEPAPALRHSA